MGHGSRRASTEVVRERNPARVLGEARRAKWVGNVLVPICRGTLRVSAPKVWHKTMRAEGTAMKVEGNVGESTELRLV